MEKQPTELPVVELVGGSKTYIKEDGTPVTAFADVNLTVAP